MSLVSNDMFVADRAGDSGMLLCEDVGVRLAGEPAVGEGVPLFCCCCVLLDWRPKPRLGGMC